MSNHQPLLEMAGPDLYLRNPFRLLDVPVTASGMAVRRQSEKIRKRLEFDAEAADVGGPLRLPFTPSSEDLALAPQVIQDPQKRLIAELFWFWPAATGSGDGSDPAFGALAAGDPATAAALWSKAGSDGADGARAVHNLAVLYHALALDGEQTEGDVSPRGGAESDLPAVWGCALSLWNEVLARDDVWAVLCERVQALDDPQLTEAAVPAIREALPAALLAVNARLAVEAAERSDIAALARQREILRTLPFSQVLVEQALHDAVRQRVRDLDAAITQADAEADADVIAAPDAVRRLLARAGPTLIVLDRVLGKGDGFRDGICDKLVNGVTNIVVGFGNKAERWAEVVALLEAVLPIADGLPAKTRLEDNLKTARERLQESVCWFCGVNPPDENCNITQDMYGEVVRTPTPTGTRINWRYQKISVPRCPNCAAWHDIYVENKSTSIIMGVLISFISIPFFLFARGTALAGRHSDSMFFVAMGIFVVGMSLVFLYRVVFCRNNAEIEHGSRPENLRPASDFLQYPAIRDCLTKGWRFGKEPES